MKGYKSFEYFMNRAMALESDVELYPKKMLSEFLDGKSAIKISKEYGYRYEDCRKILLKTAKKTLGKILKKETRRLLLYVPDIRNFRDELSKKLS